MCNLKHQGKYLFLWNTKSNYWHPRVCKLCFTHWKAYWFCSEPSVLSKTRQDTRIVRGPLLMRNISMLSEYLGNIPPMLERTICNASQKSTPCSVQHCISLFLILLLSHRVNYSHFHTLQF